MVALLPFIYIWKIIKEVLDVAPHFEQATSLVYNGIWAMVFAIVAFLVYILALMCSHLVAFRVATNMRIATTEHLSQLPLGYVDSFGSGKLRKIINDSTGATETFLAHQLPDKYAAIATPVGLLVLLFVFDWRLGLLSLVPVILAFLIMSGMTGKRMAEKMRQYGNALENMSNEAVEYVRGIPVVKTFGQTVYSFKKFKGTIDEYEKWVVSYTKDLRIPMMFYTAIINSVFAFLIASAFWFTHKGVTNAFILNLIFYIIITPVISLTLTKLMYMSENNMIVADALARIDLILDAKPLGEAQTEAKMLDANIKMEDVRLYYRHVMCNNFLTKMASKKSKAYTEKGRRKLKSDAKKSESNTNPYSWRFSVVDGKTINQYTAYFYTCGICHLMKELGLSKYIPAMCTLDYDMAELNNTKFTRQYTLASGGKYCDCHYDHQN